MRGLLHQYLRQAHAQAERHPAQSAVNVSSRDGFNDANMRIRRVASLDQCGRFIGTSAIVQRNRCGGMHAPKPGRMGILPGKNRH